MQLEDVIRMHTVSERIFQSLCQSLTGLMTLAAWCKSNEHVKCAFQACFPANVMLEDQLEFLVRVEFQNAHRHPLYPRGTLLQRICVSICMLQQDAYLMAMHKIVDFSTFHLRFFDEDIFTTWLNECANEETCNILELIIRTHIRSMPDANYYTVHEECEVLSQDNRYNLCITLEKHHIRVYLSERYRNRSTAFYWFAISVARMAINMDTTMEGLTNIMCSLVIPHIGSLCDGARLQKKIMRQVEEMHRDCNAERLVK